jgi:hypothetical protein
VASGDSHYSADRLEQTARLFQIRPGQQKTLSKRLIKTSKKFYPLGRYGILANALKLGFSRSGRAIWATEISVLETSYRFTPFPAACAVAPSFAVAIADCDHSMPG